MKSKGVFSSMKGKAILTNSTDITTEDIKVFKRELDMANIPKRDYIVGVFCDDKGAEEFIKDFGERLKDNYAANH